MKKSLKVSFYIVSFCVVMYGLSYLAFRLEHWAW